MPFEVGKTLAQVQWVPREGLETPAWIGNEDLPDEEAIEVSLFTFYSSFLKSRWGAWEWRERHKMDFLHTLLRVVFTLHAGTLY